MADKERTVITVEPWLRSCRFNQLTAGDLFIYMHDNGSCIGLKVVDPTDNDEPLLLPFGPTFPNGLDGPYLLPRQNANVISFGKEYVLKLPVHAEGWSQLEPTKKHSAFLQLAKHISFEQIVLIDPVTFRACYVDLMTGRIQVKENGWHREVMRPPGAMGVALEWGLMTTEPEPRVIFAQRATGT
jgi:hypothetical protein